MAMAVNKLDEANNYLKEALTAQPSNLELRAFYLYFLIQTTASSPQTARFALEFAYKTLSDNRNDVYTLCAAGSLSYRAAREAKPTAKEQQSESAMRAFGKEKTKNYLRAVEYFDRALGVDPECSFAAQGMAIAIAEDAFVTAAGQVPNGDSATRIGNARQALAVFQRVRESLTEGSVYVNMGHCYFANDEFERAIESVRLPFFFWFCIFIFHFQSRVTKLTERSTSLK
jgi:RNA polymerase-associated protein CTR9